MQFFNWNLLNRLLAIINPIPYTLYAMAYGMGLASPNALFEPETWHLASFAGIERGLLYSVPQYAIIMCISAAVLPSTVSGFKQLLRQRDHGNAVLKLSMYVLCALSAAIIAGTIAWSATAPHTLIELMFAMVSTFSFVVFSFLTRFLGSKRIFELVAQLVKGQHIEQLKIRAQLLAVPADTDDEVRLFRKYRMLHRIGLMLAVNTVFTWPIFAAQGYHFLELMGTSGHPIATQFFAYALSISSWMFYAASAYHAPALLDVYLRDTCMCHPHQGLSLALLKNVFPKVCLLFGFYLASYSLHGLAQYTVDAHLLDALGAQHLTVASFWILQAHFNTSITSAGASLPLLIQRHRQSYTDHKETASIDLALCQREQT